MNTALDPCLVKLPHLSNLTQTFSEICIHLTQDNPDYQPLIIDNNKKNREKSSSKSQSLSVPKCFEFVPNRKIFSFISFIILDKVANLQWVMFCVCVFLLDFKLLSVNFLDRLTVSVIFNIILPLVVVSVVLNVCSGCSLVALLKGLLQPWTCDPAYFWMFWVLNVNVMSAWIYKHDLTTLFSADAVDKCQLLEQTLLSGWCCVPLCSVKKQLE